MRNIYTENELKTRKVDIEGERLQLEIEKHKEHLKQQKAITITLIITSSLFIAYTLLITVYFMFIH